jgi:hypothetical protein
VFSFVIARVIPETMVVKIGFVDFNRASLIAKHELLEVQETSIVAS